jgi:predicted DNA-binding transcriptional regulator AlpA
MSEAVVKAGRRLLTVIEVAAACGISTRKVWRLVADPGSGFPSSVKIGSRGTRWCSCAVDAYLEKLVGTTAKGGRS